MTPLIPKEIFRRFLIPQERHTLIEYKKNLLKKWINFKEEDWLSIMKQILVDITYIN